MKPSAADKEQVWRLPQPALQTASGSSRPQLRYIEINP